MFGPRFDKASEQIATVLIPKFVARHKELSKNCHHACVCVYACMFDLCVCKLPGTTFTFSEAHEVSCRASVFVSHQGIGSPDNLSGLLLRAQTQV